MTLAATGTLVVLPWDNNLTYQSDRNYFFANYLPVDLFKTTFDLSPTPTNRALPFELTQFAPSSVPDPHSAYCMLGLPVHDFHVCGTLVHYGNITVDNYATEFKSEEISPVSYVSWRTGPGYDYLYKLLTGKA